MQKPQRFPGFFEGAIKHKSHYRTLRKNLEAHGWQSVGLANVR